MGMKEMGDKLDKIFNGRFFQDADEELNKKMKKIDEAMDETLK